MGFELDLLQGQTVVPEEKISSLKAQLRKAADTQGLSARQLASIIGKIISMSLAIGPISQLMTRNMYAMLNKRDYWCQVLAMTEEAREEVNFWVGQIDCINGREIWHSPSAIRVVYSDASNTGYGGYMVEHGCHIAHGRWFEEEAGRSSTWREIRAVRLVLESLIPMLKNERIQWFSDNQNVVRILQAGSRKVELHWPCMLWQQGI